jgi:cyclopropane fatty-acyl-phospholipid synthase-like methyltransferase
MGPWCRRCGRSGRAAVLDLGCGEGKLLRELLKEKQFERVVGMDVSSGRSRSRGAAEARRDAASGSAPASS